MSVKLKNISAVGVVRLGEVGTYKAQWEEWAEISEAGKTKLLAPALVTTYILAQDELDAFRLWTERYDKDARLAKI